MRQEISQLAYNLHQKCSGQTIGLDIYEGNTLSEAQPNVRSTRTLDMDVSPL